MIANPTVRMIQPSATKRTRLSLQSANPAFIERRDRVEDTVPECRAEAEVVGEPKPRRQHGCCERLEDRREHDYAHDDAPHVGDVRDPAFDLRYQAAAKPEPTREQEREQ